MIWKRRSPPYGSLAWVRWQILRYGLNLGQRSTEDLERGVNDPEWSDGPFKRMARAELRRREELDR